MRRVGILLKAEALQINAVFGGVLLSSTQEKSLAAQRPRT